MKQKRKNRTLELVIGSSTVQSLSSVRILLVGAGGIGCEVAKNLSRLAISSLTILDCDLIEQTNLNRQFYYRKAHIGQSKSHILRDQLLPLAPSLSIHSLCDNLYNPQFNDSFFSKFDVIISALDSTKARQHLATHATRNGLPLIDAGTMSYHGQAYASIRFLTACHNCHPTKHEEQTAAVCLIRSRPERPIHCATYAKNFYQSFFGSERNETMSDRLKFDRFIDPGQKYTKEMLRDIAGDIFTELFDTGITDVDIEGNAIDVVRKIKLADAMTSIQKVENPQSTLDRAEQLKQQTSPYRQEQLWSLHDYAQGFITTCMHMIQRHFQGNAPALFEKDDEDCMLLVYCLTNLRTYNFMNWLSPHNKHQFLTYYRCKDLVGRVMPAIASANAIAAALEIRQLINVVGKRLDKMRLIHFSNVDQERLSPCFQSGPSVSCQYCSQKVIYAKVLLDMSRVLFGEFEQFAKQQLFSFGRDLYSGPLVIIRNGKQTPSPNKSKPISHFKELIKEGVLPVSYRALLTGTPVTVHISIFNEEAAEGISLMGTQTKRERRLQLLRYFRKVERERVDGLTEEVRLFGGYQM